ncbi:MAG: DsrE/DsrF/DrsH-like family protein [Promethearchaeati archaeon SRVP18_Atabeyarchaeia-1]
MSENKGGLAIISCSGQADKLLPVGVLSSTAAAMGVPVRVFFTGFALASIMKGGIKDKPRFTKEFEDMVPKMISGMQKMKAPSWYDMLKKAKQSGDVKVYGCSTTVEMLGLKKETLDPIVDDIVGAATLMEQTAGYQILFI